jgi:hypothetical protein
MGVAVGRRQSAKAHQKTASRLKKDEDHHGDTHAPVPLPEIRLCHGDTLFLSLRFTFPLPAVIGDLSADLCPYAKELGYKVHLR